MKVERADVQANVVDGVGHPHGHHLIARVDDGTKALLRDLAPLVADGRPWSAKPPVLRNVAVSASGLRALGVDPSVVGLLGDAFVGGMASRADAIGDDPAGWVPGFASGDAQLLLWVHADTAERCDEEVDRWRARLDVVHELRTSMHTGMREHFGFGDGYAQPEIAGVEREPGEEGQLGRFHEEPLAAGEFLFGYRDSMGVLVRVPPLLRNGTILVWRQLAQDVAGWWAAVAGAAADVGLEPGVLAAKIVGRWPDGTPLVLAPDGPPASADVADRLALDDFRYGDDPAGWRCPLGAHVRRVNPRDGLAFDEMVTRHRLIRRGMPYGPPLAYGEPDDGVERGLLFLAFNASPERQFEFVQAQWCNDGSRVGVGADRDLVIGTPGPGHGRLVIQGQPPRFVEGFGSFVTPRAGRVLLPPWPRGPQIPRSVSDFDHLSAQITHRTVGSAAS